jgi:hypothetical protein
MTTETDDAMPGPRRTLNKQEAIRHLIHTAIRLTAKMEDPFAVHLLAHSADKMLIDLAKKRGRELRVDWEDHIKPEYHREFFERHRAAYNYFKHAARDFADDLPVHDIMRLNLMMLFIGVANYAELFKEITNHMTLLIVFAAALWPQLIRPNVEEGAQFLNGIRSFKNMTPREFFDTFYENIGILPKYPAEASKDIEDIIHFYHLSFAELHEGRTESPRLFRLPE